MSEPQDQTEADLDFRAPLRRVAYQAGMLLGVEALRDEQDYHRRRLSRGQLWLHGSGTLAGMAVSAADAAGSGVKLVVGRGAGIDGLGRELLVNESHCIHLGDWLAAHGDELEGAFDRDNGRLHLRVTARYRPCPRGLQPVLAEGVNQGTDPVAYSRDGDGVQLELTPDPGWGAGGGDAWSGWSAGEPLDRQGTPLLTDTERTYLDAQPEERRAMMRLRANLLHADLPESPSAEEGFRQEVQRALEERARILLARVTVVTAELPTATLTPADVEINNLVRPFIHTCGQWTALTLAPAAPLPPRPTTPDGYLAPDGPPFVPAARRADDTL